MRLVIYTGLFLFIFGSAWVLYLDTQNKKFMEGLSHPPVPSKTVTHTDPDSDIIENAHSQKIHAHPPSDDLMPDPPHVHPHRPVSNHSHDNDSHNVMELTRPMEDTRPTEAKLDEKRDEDLSQGPPPEGFNYDREKIRQGLIHEFGDIPEVDIVLQHMPVDIEAGQVVKVRHVGTHADVLEYQKALSILWPTPENLRAVERTKELMEWRGGPLPSWVNPDHVRYTHE